MIQKSFLGIKEFTKAERWAGLFVFLGLISGILGILSWFYCRDIYADGGLGSLGDFIGGTTGSLWLLASVILFYESLRTQRKELQEVRKESKSQTKQFKEQVQEMRDAKILDGIYRNHDEYKKYLQNLKHHDLLGLLVLVHFSDGFKKGGSDNSVNNRILGSYIEFMRSDSYKLFIEYLTNSFLYFNTIKPLINTQNEIWIVINFRAKFYQEYCGLVLKYLLEKKQNYSGYDELIELHEELERMLEGRR